MNRIEILAMVTPIFVGTFVIALVSVTNYFDDKAAAAERKAKLSSAHDDAKRIVSAAE